ncbi:hypothetical protein [Micromonospora sp. CA-244673]|uniref:hypothetical protein n=1 Tax=Micromonospora sp. CA-244673 TaxID=3239958 RepID=UPI003D912F4A
MPSISARPSVSWPAGTFPPSTSTRTGLPSRRSAKSPVPARVVPVRISQLGVSRSVPGVGSAEILSPTRVQLLHAVRDDTVAAFVAAHPTWVADSGPTPADH